MLNVILGGSREGHNLIQFRLNYRNYLQFSLNEVVIKCWRTISLARTS